MDCFGAFFCFLAYSLSGFPRFFAYSFSRFLRLSADSLSGLLGFFSDCFSSFLGFFARRLKSVFYRLPCFFCSLLYVLQCSFLPERGKSRSRDQRYNKARYFHDWLLFICCPCTKKTDETHEPRALSLITPTTRVAFAARTFVKGREFREWDAENVKR